MMASLTDLADRGQMNSQVHVIVSGVPSRREKKGMPDHRLPSLV